MRRALLAVSAPVILGLALPAPVLAQGEHATPLRPGTVRVGVGGWWSHAEDRFAAPTPVTPTVAEGSIEPLGWFFGDSLGTTQLPWLATTEAELRALTGLGGYALNLGRSRLTVETSVRNTPIRLDVALSRRLVLGVAVPIVRARTYAFQALPDSTPASQGNVGWNPEELSAGTYDVFRLDVDSALAALALQATSGPPALRSQAAATLAAWQPFLCGLYVLGAGPAPSQASLCWDAASGPQATFLPVDTTDAGDSLATRLARAQADYDALRLQYAGLGVTIPAFTAGYALPTAALDSNGIRTYTSSPLYPLAAETLTTVVRTGIGDIELGGWYQVADREHWRGQVGGILRLGTGTMDSPGNLVDVGTGDGQTDVEVWTKHDVIFSPQLWLHAGGRYGVQFAHTLPRRVAPYWQPYAPASAAATVTRTPGDYLAIDVVPNWQLDDSFGVGLGYHYYRQGATAYAYAGADSATIALLVPASVLGEGTSVSRMRVGAGVTFSTLNRYLAGRARLPYRVTWSYQRTFFGRGGQVERASVMSLVVEAFVSPF
jgi:hypothetical protein